MLHKELMTIICCLVSQSTLPL